MAADKLHNTRATIADLELVGESVWIRSSTGQDGFIWYHEQITEALRDLLPESRSVRLLATKLRG